MIESRGTRRTGRLLIVGLCCLVAIPVFVVLHNLFDRLSGMTGDVVILSRSLEFLSAVSFLAALFLCPAAVAICLVAALLNELTTTWKRAPRLILLFLVPALAAVAAVTILSRSLSLSTIERDSQAGFNGSFEAVKSGLPVNWHVYHRPLDDGDAEISYDSNDPVDGTHSLKLLVHRAEPVGGWRSPGLFQGIDALGGETYQVSFWLKNRNCRIRLRITSVRPESREPPDPIRDDIDAERTGYDTWRQFVYTYTVPEHRNDIRFELNVVAPGTLWVDDVRIEPLPDKRLGSQAAGKTPDSGALLSGVSMRARASSS